MRWIPGTTVVQLLGIHLKSQVMPVSLSIVANCPFKIGDIPRRCVCSEMLAFLEELKKPKRSLETKDW